MEKNTLWELQKERIILKIMSGPTLWLSFCGLFAVFTLKKPLIAENMDSQHPCWLHSSFICKSYWRWILKGNKERLETVQTIYGRLQQRSLFRQEDGAVCEVKLEESCVVPTHSPELSDSIKTRKRQKILSKNPDSADAMEKDTLNAMLQHTERAKCCSFS